MNPSICAERHKTKGMSRANFLWIFVYGLGESGAIGARASP